MHRRFAPLIAVLVSVAGCGSTPASPSALGVFDRGLAPVLSTSTAASLMGHWSGSIIDPISGEGALSLSFTELTANQAIGTWSATFRNGERFSGRASSAPVVSGNGVVMISDTPLNCAGPTLSFSLINMAVSATELTAGTWRTTCTGVNIGSVRLSKQ
jgi:hypothetical protein